MIATDPQSSAGKVFWHLTMPTRSRAEHSHFPPHPDAAGGLEPTTVGLKDAHLQANCRS